MVYKGHRFEILSNWKKQQVKSGIHLWIRSKDHDMIGSILRGTVKLLQNN